MTKICKKCKQLKPICKECGQEYDSAIELLAKYHKGNICEDCSRELFEMEIGYEDN